jgi:hypothetical protein
LRESSAGLTAVHQFCRIGSAPRLTGWLLEDRAGRAAVHDCRRQPAKVRSYNKVGLERRGFREETMRAIKEAYRIIYRAHLNLQQAVEQIRSDLPELPEIEQIVAFVTSSPRGILSSDAEIARSRDGTPCHPTPMKCGTFSQEDGLADGTECRPYRHSRAEYEVSGTVDLRRRKCPRGDSRIFLRRKLRGFGEPLLRGSDYFFHQRTAAAVEDENVFRFSFEAVEDHVFAQEFRLVRDLVGGQIEFLRQLAPAAFAHKPEPAPVLNRGHEITKNVPRNTAGLRAHARHGPGDFLAEQILRVEDNVVFGR